MFNTVSEALVRVPYFAKLEADVVEQLAQEVHRRAVLAEETVVTDGDKLDELHFVVQGRFKVYKVSTEGREQVLPHPWAGPYLQRYRGLPPGTVRGACSGCLEQ